MALDGVLTQHVESCGTQLPLPFESALSPTILTSIFRSIWSNVGGIVEPDGCREAVKSDEVGCDGEVGVGEEDGEGKMDDGDTLSTSGDTLASNQSPLSHGIIVTGTGEWDYESDCDSLIHHSRGRMKPVDVRNLEGWENLDDESTMCLDSSEDTASLTSFEDESYVNDLSSASSLEPSYTSDESLASVATKKTSSGKYLQASRDILENITKETIGAKAVKSDDAAVPVHLWNLRILKSGDEDMVSRTKALDGLRKFGLHLFRRGLLRDCLVQLKRKFGLAWPMMAKSSKSGKLTRVGKELAAMRNLLWHATHTSWFEYEAGSRLYHFRFPIRYRTLARDGVPIFFEKPGPSFMKPQPEFSDPTVRGIVKGKIEKVIKRRYMTKVCTGLKLCSLIKYFAVPKGDDDFRMVYDGTASGLNDAVWAPSFWLPTVESLVRALDSNSWMADRDIGEMFLNFQLHETAWPFAGVDIRPILDEKRKCSMDRWYVWVRNAMGFKSSPYNSVKMTLIAEEVILGDRLDPSNPFQWDSVRLNLPGTRTYDPTCSWIAKVRVDGLNACILVTFVDDERVAGATRELTWQAGRRLAQIESYFGIQDASRKVGKCLQQPRAWAGSVVHVIPGSGVYVLTSEEKWLKMKGIVEKWLGRLDSGAKVLDHKEFVSDRGFLVYTTQSYPDMKPYLKGFHLTAEMWRGGRDEDGWKLPVTEDRDSIGSTVLEGDEDDAALGHATKIEGRLYAPSNGKTPPAPRLREDLEALKILTQFDTPPMRVVRPKRTVHVFYGFADASGKGKGSTYQGYKTRHHSSGQLGPLNDVVFRVGVWGSDEESESSNYREFTNLVEATEAEACTGAFTESEMFLFTDNSTTESAFYKGSSSSKLLHALVLRLHKLCLEYQIQIHVIHISGKRMIAQGTDGCSRGILLEGVMSGQDMLSFLDLDKSAIDRCPKLLDWVRDWTMQPELAPLTPEEWFVEGHGIVGGHLDDHGVWMPDHEPAGKMHLWAPAPAVADAVDLVMRSVSAKGRINAEGFIQYDSVRKLRASFSKLWLSSPKGCSEGSAFFGSVTKYRFTSAPTQSEAFGDFLIGCEARMGFDTRKQLYLPIPVILEQLRLVKRDAEDTEDPHYSKTLYKFGSLICILTAASLRGHEGFYTDLAATRKHITKGRDGVVPTNVLKRAILTEEECSNLPEVCLCLLGKFKGENNERCHSVVLPNVTSSGLEVRWWIEKLLEVCESEGRTSGYAFWRDNKTPPRVMEYNALVRDYLREIQDNKPELFDPEHDLSRYGTSRTYRKSSENRARRAGIKADDIKVMNRWNVFENAQGRRPRLAMIDHYSDARSLVTITWRYGYAL